MRGLRKHVMGTQFLGRPKYKDYHRYRKCPVQSCSAVVKRVSVHLRGVHGLLCNSPLFLKYLKQAKRALEVEQLESNGLVDKEPLDITDEWTQVGEETVLRIPLSLS